MRSTIHEDSIKTRHDLYLRYGGNAKRKHMVEGGGEKWYY